MANTFKNAKLLLTGSLATIYTCPAATTAIIFSMVIANIDGANSADVTIEWEDNSDSSADFDILSTVPVPPDTSLVYPGKIVLEASDLLRGLASATNDLEVTLSVLEIT